MVKVKICGITNLEDAISAQAQGADFLGFVFAESPRRIKADKAKRIIERLNTGIKVVALFVNEEKKAVDNILKELERVDILQFHGDDTPDYCRQFREKEVIKAIRIKDASSLKKIDEFKGVDYLLLDTFHSAQYGGTGMAFDWDIAVEAKDYGIPIFLSGGLNAGNVRDAVVKLRPFAVDVSSGVEKSPCRKDPEMVGRFIDIAKSA